MSRIAKYFGIINLGVALLAWGMTAHASGPSSNPVEACKLELPPPTARRLLDAKGTGAVVYPPALPPRFNGCQRSWTQFDGLRERSIPLMDTHFVEGRPARVVVYAVGAERTVVSDCKYVGGALDAAISMRPAGCPSGPALIEASKQGTSTSGIRIP